MSNPFIFLRNFNKRRGGNIGPADIAHFLSELQAQDDFSALQDAIVRSWFLTSIERLSEKPRKYTNRQPKNTRTAREEVRVSIAATKKNIEVAIEKKAHALFSKYLLRNGKMIWDAHYSEVIAYHETEGENLRVAAGVLAAGKPPTDARVRDYLTEKAFLQIINEASLVASAA